MDADAKLDDLLDRLLAELANRVETQAQILGIREVAARYGVKRTKAYELIREPWFPRPLIDSPLRWSLSSLLAAEDRRDASMSTTGLPPRPVRRTEA